MLTSGIRWYRVYRSQRAPQEFTTVAHLIEDGKRFMEVGTEDGAALSWHRLGTVIKRADQATTTVEEAFKLGGLVFDVNTYPAAYQLPDGTFVTTDKFLIVREAHEFAGEQKPAMLLSDNVVGSGYVPIDNRDLAKSLEPLRATWPIETCGVLKDGKIVFACFNAGGFSVKGKDEHKMFLLAMEAKDGSGALKIMVTPVRVVCNNTLVLGIDAAEWSANVRHDNTALRDLDFWSRMMPQLASQTESVHETLEALAGAKATKLHVMKIIDATFPKPQATPKMKLAGFTELKLTDADTAIIGEDQKKFRSRIESTTGLRELALERYDIFNQQNPATAGTLFAVAQAANEVAMWRPGRGATVDATIFENQIVGNRADASKRAFRTAVGLLK